MYTIYADDICIYNDVFAVGDLKIASPKLVMEDCAAGSLTMTLPPSNKAYNTIARLTTDIRVDKDGKELWSGRVLSESKDFWNNRILVCEGELAFFNDSTQPPKEYSGLSIRAFMSDLIAVHNSKVAPNRRFAIGVVTVEDTDYPTRYTNNERTIELFNALIEQYGGHLRIRKENGVRYVDYLKDYPDTCSQLIQFGSNMIEFTRNWDSTEFATVLVPLGGRLDKSPIEALDAFLTVESVNNGSMYIQSDEAVAAFGWIEKVVTWNDVNDPAILLAKAKTYLSDLQFDNMELQLSALDLHYMDVNYEAVKLLDEIRVISRPHGLDRQFPVTKLEIPLDSPEKTQFTLGSTVKIGLTSVNNQINSAIIQKIEKLPKAHNILKEAKENATQIMNMATTGYITITKDEHGSETLYISNTRDYTKADRFWMWNMNGLAYFDKDNPNFNNPDDLKIALTMDGKITADFITTGTMSADRVRTGLLKSENDVTVFNLDTGELTMKKGSIYIGTMKDDNGEDVAAFSVDSNGNLFARRGTFAGTLSGAKGTFGGELVAASGDFKGTLKAAKIYGDLVSDSEVGGWLRGCGISVGGDNWEKGIGKFYVDTEGNVTMTGNLTLSNGAISWSNLDSGTQSTISNANTAAGNAQATANAASAAASSAQNTVNGWCYPGTTSIDGNKIMTGTVQASKLRGGTVELLDSYGSTNGVISLTDASTGAYAVDLSSYAALRLGSGWGNIFLSAYYNSVWLQLGQDNVGRIKVSTNCSFVSETGSDLGSYDHLWGNVYASNGVIQTSDLREKESVRQGLDEYGDFFDRLRPVSYRFIHGQSGRRHLGFIAQDVERAMNDCGVSSKDFAGLIKSPNLDKNGDELPGEYTYALRYGEFIPLCVDQIQKLKARISELASKIP